MIKIKIYLTLLLGIISLHLFGATYFATPLGAGSKNGSNWANAVGTEEFSRKLIAASSGDIFYLSEGTYTPLLDKTGATPSNAGNKTFRLLPGVQIFGSYKTGLAATAHAETDRNLESASGGLSPSTVFNGGDVSFIVIDAQNDRITSTNAVVLNGITVTGSQMAAILSEKSNLELTSCKIIDNTLTSGGSYVGSVESAAIHQKGGSCTIKDSEISGNDLNGGDMGVSAPVWIEDGVLDVINSLIADNDATGDGGAPAILLERSTGNVINTTISGNTSTNDALGAITVGTQSTLNVTNATITDNGTGISLLYEGTPDAKLKLDNSIVSGNDKDLALYKDNVGSTTPNTTITTPQGILGVVSTGSDIPKYTIVGNSLYNSTTGTNVGFNASTHLGGLADNGGPTKTHKLLDTANNPAFEKGNPAYAGVEGSTDELKKDQRGATRLSPNPCIGAYDGRDEDTDKVKLQLTLFLEGVMIANKKMSNYLQTHDPVYSFYDKAPYPVNDPYSLGTTYNQFSNVAGPAGEIVDWIRVEIWSAVNMSNSAHTVSQSKALLLKTNGVVVDENGKTPSFEPVLGAVRIIVKHRNHLAVMSKEIPSFTGTLSYDFSSDLTQAPLIELSTDPDFLVLKNGAYCLRVGDLNMDGIVDSADRIFSFNDYNDNDQYDKYINTDINMDGIVDSADYVPIYDAYIRQLYSALFYFE